MRRDGRMAHDAGRRRSAATRSRSGSAATASTTSSPSGSTSTARRACKGVPASARCDAFLGGSRRVRRRGDGRHGPGPAQPRPRRHAGLRHATRSCPGRRASPGSRCDIQVDGEAVALLLADGPQAGDRAARRRSATRCRSASRPSTCSSRARAGRLDRAVRPDRRRHAREALLRLQGPVGEPAATCAS